MIRFISVVSGKGGVGKTTTAVNLAIACHNTGANIMLMDCDFNNPNVALHLGMPRKEGLYDVAVRKSKLKDIIFTHESGLKVIPCTIGLKRANKIMPIHINRILSQIEAETVFLDCPPGLGKDVEMSLLHKDECIVVTNPNLSAIADAIKMIEFCEGKGVTVLGVVMNRYVGDKHDVSVEDAVNLLGRPIISVIPEDGRVRRAARQNSPVSVCYPNTKSVKAYRSLGNTLMGIEEKSLFSKIFGR